MFGRLVSRDASFFDLFDRHAGCVVEGARELRSLVSGSEPIGPKAARIKELEHEADEITHQCVEALHKSFITPIDRDAIHRLITRMDDVMDAANAAAERISLYEMTEMTEDLKDLADVLVRSAEEVARSVKVLNDTRDAEVLRQKCIDVGRLEKEADAILRNALARLFRTEKNPIAVIKLKEIYEILETATDRCADVANVIEGIALEHE